MGGDIKEKVGLYENIIDNRVDVILIIVVLKLDICIVLIYINVLYWFDYGGKNNLCEDCI